MTLPNPQAEQRESIANLRTWIGALKSTDDLPGDLNPVWLKQHLSALIDHLEADGGAEAMKERAATFAFEQCDDERGEVWNAACAHVANAFRYEANPFGHARALPTKAPSHAS